MKTISSQDFERDIEAAKRAALDGPLLITESEKPSLVLMNIDDYRELTGIGESVAEAFAKLPDSGSDDIEFKSAFDGLPKSADLSD